MLKTFKIQISGRVQGVGFRPFVYLLAHKYGLSGFVSNNEEGVLIELTCNIDKAELFIEDLKLHPPPLAVLKSASIKEVTNKKYDGFSIIPTPKSTRLNLPLTPDFTICSECKNELIDGENRRYNYPFISCVNCGPRYAVTQKFPFERKNTSMVEFEMCEPCYQEYANPDNRRFHSQTNSCPSCGISIYIHDKNGNKENLKEEKVIERIARLIRKGKIVAIKNTGGYLLCCDASNVQAIQKLRDKKHRPSKPFALMYPSLGVLKKELIINPTVEKEISSHYSPIVIIGKKGYRGSVALDEVAPNLNQVGLMLPYSGLMYLLMRALGFPIVATSGNISGSPIISTVEDADEKLSNVADYLLHHNLTIENPQDDSVVKFSNEFSYRILFRRSRGIAPNYLDYSITSTKNILAMGSHLKNTISYTPNSCLYVSPYLGNLDGYEVCQRYEKTIAQYLDFFNTVPEVIIVDKHKAYHSSLIGIDMAGKLHAELHYVQHHKAHFASVLGEQNLFESQEKILGVIWDGTGLGDDEMIWGGEFFTYENNTMNRLTHFEYFDWLLGEKMATEPRISLLCLSTPKSEYLVKPKFSEVEWDIYLKKRQSNTLKTSSVGRIFDAVAALLGLTDVNTYEGEAAILLENSIDEVNYNELKDYLHNETYNVVPSILLVEKIAEDINRNISVSKIAANFIYTLACIIISVARKHHYKIIAMSGGVFQNTTLIDMVLRVSGSEFVCKFNTEFPPNDENISFGQIMYYQNIK